MRNLIRALLTSINFLFLGDQPALLLLQLTRLSLVLCPLHPARLPIKIFPPDLNPGVTQHLLASLPWMTINYITLYLFPWARNLRIELGLPIFFHLLRLCQLPNPRHSALFVSDLRLLSCETPGCFPNWSFVFFVPFRSGNHQLCQNVFISQMQT